MNTGGNISNSIFFKENGLKILYNEELALKIRKLVKS